jgi:hypothetical protein
VVVAVAVVVIIILLLACLLAGFPACYWLSGFLAGLLLACWRSIYFMRN